MVNVLKNTWFFTAIFFVSISIDVIADYYLPVRSPAHFWLSVLSFCLLGTIGQLYQKLWRDAETEGRVTITIERKDSGLSARGVVYPTGGENLNEVVETTVKVLNAGLDKLEARMKDAY